MFYFCSEGSELIVSGISLGDKGTAWVVDVVGRVWFTTGVRWDTPCGSGQWWQVGNHSVLLKKIGRKKHLTVIMNILMKSVIIYVIAPKS